MILNLMIKMNCGFKKEEKVTTLMLYLVARLVSQLSVWSAKGICIGLYIGKFCVIDFFCLFFLIYFLLSFAGVSSNFLYPWLKVQDVALFC